MKQIIPINTIGEVSRTIYAHYAQAGWHDFDPTSPVPHTAILEIEMEEPKPMQVAQIYDREQNPMNGRVYSQDGIAPTLRTPTGGLSEPKIQVAVTIDSGIGNWSTRQDDKVYDPQGVSPTIAIARTNHAPKIMQIGSYVPTSKCAGKVVDADGIAPTVMENHGMPTAVVEPAIVIGSMQANAMRGSIDGVSPCLTEAMGMGGGQIPMIVQRPHGNNPGGVKQGYIAPTITTSAWQDNNHLVEPCGCYDNQFGEFAREPIEGVARTLKADHHNAVLLKYRIRKLTPTECFRLMDCDDEDIQKILNAQVPQTLKSGKVRYKPLPKTAAYKLAGNSICVAPLYYIFRNMFIPEFQSKTPVQKSLFDL